MAEREEDRVDLVLTDLVMPRMDGRELTARLQKIYPGIRILIMSGHAGDGNSAERVLSAGMGFLAKPFTPESLKTAVRNVLDGLEVLSLGDSK